MAPFISLFGPPPPRPCALRLSLRTRTTPGRLRRHLVAARLRSLKERRLP
jgi:hypothetical protein